MYFFGKIEENLWISEKNILEAGAERGEMNECRLLV
jgi:hypothetical protein